jgi:hypothetical protein
LISECIEELHAASNLHEASNIDWGIKWTEFARNNKLITKKKYFPSETARDKFIDKLEQMDNFNQIIAYLDPQVSEMTTTANIAGYDAPLGTKLKDLVDDEGDD